MAPVILFHGDKGGVGKSFLCATALDYLVANDKPVVIVETDETNADVGRRFRAADPHRISLLEHDGFMEFLSVVHQAGEAPVVVNTAAGVGNSLLREQRFLTGGLEALGCDLHILFVLSRDVDPVARLKATLEGLPGARYTAILNGYFGAAEQFTVWQDSSCRKAFLKAGHKEIYFPELHKRVASALPLDKSWTEALTAGALPFGERYELEHWLRGAHELMATIL